MKPTTLNYILSVLFIAVLVVSIVNTLLIVDNNKTLTKKLEDEKARQNQVAAQTNMSLNQLNVTDDLLNGKIDNLNVRLPIEQYDYIIYRYWNNISVYVAKNGRSGSVEFNSTDAASVFNKAVSNGNSVYVKSDEYQFKSDILVTNKKNARLDSDGAALVLNGHKIIVRGDDFEHSQNNQISGFVIRNGTVRIENSFRSTLTNMIFEESSIGVELANTNTWTEGTRIDTVHFDRCLQAIVFRTNTSILGVGNSTSSTGSYANTQITRSYFNQRDNSIAITVERQAEFTDSQMQNDRLWLGEFDQFNQTGLLLEGSMYKTVLDGVVFESFAHLPLNNASFYAIRIGRTAFQAPILDSGFNVLGSWTARIFNPHGVWIYGVGGVFGQTNINISVGSLNSYGDAQVIQVHPATIADFKPKVRVAGAFGENENITVRFRVEFIDNVVSGSVEKTFTNSSSIWLSNDDFLHLFSYPNVVYAILVDAKTSSTATDVTVLVDVYGITT